MTIRGSLGRLMVAVGTAILIATSSAFALDDFQFTETATYDIGAEALIDIESVAGDVTYVGGSASETNVEMIIDVRAKSEEEARQIRQEIDIRVESDDDLLEVWVDRPDKFSRILRRQFGKNRSISVSFHITGPEGARGSLSTVSGIVSAEQMTGPVDATSVSGDVSIRDVEKRVRANSVSGQVTVADCGDYVHAETVSGDVDVSHCGGDLEAKSVSGHVAIASVTGDAGVSSVSGDIDVQEVAGDLAAQTTSGQIDVEHQQGDLVLRTLSGDIVARSASTDGDLDISSHSGSVRLYANVAQIGKIELSTFSGEIHVDSDLGGGNAIGRGTRGRGDISLTLGDGDVIVDMSTFSGDMYIGEL